MYPNPASERISLTYTLVESSSISIALYDAIGWMMHVFANPSLTSIGRHEVSYNLPAGLLGGVYFVRVNSERGGRVMKVVVGE